MPAVKDGAAGAVDVALEDDEVVGEVENAVVVCTLVLDDLTEAELVCLDVEAVDLSELLVFTELALLVLT